MRSHYVMQRVYEEFIDGSENIISKYRFLKSISGVYDDATCQLEMSRVVFRAYCVSSDDYGDSWHFSWVNARQLMDENICMRVFVSRPENVARVDRILDDVVLREKE